MRLGDEPLVHAAADPRGGRAVAVSVALTTRMQHQWQMTLLWGICVGTGTGVTSMVLAAVVATRWFVARRGWCSAHSPRQRHRTARLSAVLARVVQNQGWRVPPLIVAGAAMMVFAVVLVFMRDRPEDLGPARVCPAALTGGAPALP